MIEYLPWYQTGENFVRCAECAAVIVSGDTGTHTAWHERVSR